MIKLYVTHPFGQPVAVKCHRFAEILNDYGIELAESPDGADLELVEGSFQAFYTHLPVQRVILLCGEPPQPWHLEPAYLVSGFGAVITPFNGAIVDPFMCAQWGTRYERRYDVRKIDRMALLSTYRDTPGNVEDGAVMEVLVNGKDRYRAFVLSRVRIALGVSLYGRYPGLIDIYGRFWPDSIKVVEDSRAGDNCLARKDEILRNYGFDLAVENMDIHYNVSEKLWDPIKAGVLPIYWGPAGIHEFLPPHSIIDLRSYVYGGALQADQLVYDILHMSEDEYVRRVRVLQDFYEAIPPDASQNSYARATVVLAHKIRELHEQLGARV